MLDTMQGPRVEAISETSQGLAPSAGDTRSGKTALAEAISYLTQRHLLEYWVLPADQGELVELSDPVVEPAFGDPGLDECHIVVGDRPVLGFLSAIGQAHVLEERALEPGSTKGGKGHAGDDALSVFKFRLLDPYALSGKCPEERVARETLSLAASVTDLRRSDSPGALFRPFQPLIDGWHAGAYAGPIDRATAYSIYLATLDRLLINIINRILPVIIVPVVELFRAAECERIANALLLGREEVDLLSMEPAGYRQATGGEEEKEDEEPVHAMRTLWHLMPDDDPIVCSWYRQLARLADVGALWDRALRLLRESGECPRTGLETCDESSKDAGRICSALESLAPISGVASLIDAYYDGVPLEDILA